MDIFRYCSSDLTIISTQANLHLSNRYIVNKLINLLPKMQISKITVMAKWDFISWSLLVSSSKSILFFLRSRRFTKFDFSQDT